jgi:hypothetical protein
MKISKVRVMTDADIIMLDNALPKLGKVKMETVLKVDTAINSLLEVTKDSPLYSKVIDLKAKFDRLSSEITYENPSGGRLMTRKYCKKTACKKMGFTQKASCRPWKNCYRKSKK